MTSTVGLLKEQIYCSLYHQTTTSDTARIIPSHELRLLMGLIELVINKSR